MKRYVCQGDIIALHGSDDGLGYLCTPPSSEPIPEREEHISHLRATVVGNPHEKASDFTSRCLFRITDERGNVRAGEHLVFGMPVRLVSPSYTSVVLAAISCALRIYKQHELH